MKNLKNICLASILVSTMLTGCLKEDENYSIGTSNPETSLFNIRNIYKDAKVTLTPENLSEAKYFKGVVVSNKDGKNLPSNFVAVQNTWRSQTRGILIEVDNNTSYNFGDSVMVNVESATLASADNMLVLKGISNDKVQLINSGNTVSSTPVSISALQNNFANYESTYVDVTADLENEPAPGTPLKGNKMLIDGEKNKLNLFTADEASFANEAVAPSATFVGIAYKQNNEIQLRLQSYQGMAYPSGRIYGGWPESFENNDIPKGSYNMAAIGNNVNFSTGQWR